MKYVPMEIKKLVLIMKVRYLLLNLLMNFNLVPVQKISHKYLRKLSPEPKSESEVTLIAKFVGRSSVLQPSGWRRKVQSPPSFLALRVPDSRIIQ